LGAQNGGREPIWGVSSAAELGDEMEMGEKMGENGGDLHDCG